METILAAAGKEALHEGLFLSLVSTNLPQSQEITDCSYFAGSQGLRAYFPDTTPIEGLFRDITYKTFKAGKVKGKVKWSFPMGMGCVVLIDEFS